MLLIAAYSLFGCQTSPENKRLAHDDLIDKPVAATLIKQPAQAKPEPAIVTPQQVANLWQRINMQFSLPELDNKHVTAQLNWYKKHPNYIQRVSKRAEPYLFFIVEELEKRNMPLEIALLPVVESAFDPFAYSHGAASGMWQIISSTGARFGLRQNWWYDGRRDVAASTYAALDYLQYLHRRFNGDWLLALAAYNSGEGRVGRAITKNRKAGKATDFWSLKLPKETRDYVPKLLALVKLIHHAKQYSMTWPHIDNKQRIALVECKSQIDLALAAKFAGISLATLYQLNPGFNRWATDPNGNHQLMLPVGNVLAFNQALANTNAKQRVKWLRYKVKQGDSLGVIAQRNQTSVAIIKDVNNIIGNRIHSGKFLLIPVAAQELSQYTLSSNTRLQSTQNKKRSGVKLTHLVQSGDNLWDIARKYKVSHRSIAKWNGMAPTDSLALGRSLVIWKKGSKSSESNNIWRTITYKVRSGDSIAKIAQKFKLKMSDVMKWNALAGKKYIQPGQRLTLRINVTKVNS